MSWQSEAACKGRQDIEWVPASDRQPGGLTRAQRQNLEAARAVCSSCPVRAECLTEALEDRGSDGIFAGTTSSERKKMRDRGRPRQHPAPCGTDAGYYRHLRSEPRTRPCDACRVEHNRVTHERKRGHRPAARRVVAECGTDGGYFRHLRVLKDQPCEECRAAHSHAERKWRLGQSG